MTYIFYDTETTGTNTAFDQILQFAAILTDEQLNERDRFEIRCRLLPWIVPSPGALLVTGIAPETLHDPALPSHFEMVRAIMAKLLSWSPAIFVGFNSITFDEELLRQAFYQTLHPPYLTNTRGNARFDILSAAHACAAFAPNTISIPINDIGKPSFRLGDLAAANGFPIINAHDALADVEGTIDVARLIKERAPSVWRGLERTCRKGDTLDLLEEEPILIHTAFYFNKEYSSLMSHCGRHPEIDTQVAMFDLAHDPEPYFGMSVEKLVKVLNASPKIIRSLRANAQPTLMTPDEFPSKVSEIGVEISEAKKRAAQIAAEAEFQQNVGRALAARFGEREPSPWPEKQIYDGFAGRDDERQMAEFHVSQDWSERNQIALRLSDERLKHFALRTVYAEAPKNLSDDHRQHIERWLNERILSDGDDVPWTTLQHAVTEAEKSSIEGLKDDREQSKVVLDYLRERVRKLSK